MLVRRKKKRKKHTLAVSHLPLLLVDFPSVGAASMALLAVKGLIESLISDVATCHTRIYHEDQTGSATLSSPFTWGLRATKPVYG